MNKRLNIIMALSFLIISGCASPPTADPSKVEAGCAQQCSGHLAKCSSGFKFFPVIAQQQCNDTYDVCIKGCPARESVNSNGKESQSTVTERLKKLDKLLESDVISKEEHADKRKDIINSL